MLQLPPVDPSRQVPYLQGAEASKTSSPITKLYHQIVRINGRMDGPAQFNRLPLGSVVYYPSSRMPDTVCVILNDPANRNMDVNFYKPKELVLEQGKLQTMTPEELQAECEKFAEREYPHRLRPYQTSEEARTVVQGGEPYAFWVIKDGANGPVPKDGANFMFQPNFIIDALSHFTGARTQALKNHPVTYDFSQFKLQMQSAGRMPSQAQLEKWYNPNGLFNNYKRNVLEERLSILQSFKKALQSQFSSKEEAQIAISAEAQKLKDLPFEVQFLVLNLGFYTSQEQGKPQLHMLYLKPAGGWEDRLISDEELKIIEDEACLIAGDLETYFKLPKEEVAALGRFEVRADLEAMHKLEAQYKNRLLRWL